MAGSFSSLVNFTEDSRSDRIYSRNLEVFSSEVIDDLKGSFIPFLQKNCFVFIVNKTAKKTSKIYQRVEKNECD